MNTKNILVSAIVALIVAIVVGVVGGNNQPQSLSVGASGTRFPNGLSTDSTSPSAGQVRGTTLTFTSTGSLGGLLTTDAGILQSYANSTSTPNSMTMKESDLLSYSSLVMMPSGAAATGITVTLPASSTLTSLVPNTGDVQKIVWINATTSVDANITLSGGTGTLLRQASSTRIDASGIGVLTLIRKANTDIIAFLTGN